MHDEVGAGVCTTEPSTAADTSCGKLDISVSPDPMADQHQPDPIHGRVTRQTPPPPPSQRAIRQRRNTPSANRPRNGSRRHSVLHQELEMLNKLHEQEKQADEEIELGRLNVLLPETHQDKTSSLSQEEDGGGNEGGRQMPSCASQKLSESHKLEDQINLQHLIELMRIFHVSS